jgi:uncharacterized membrane protein YdjX (TVP38/TMEM64 family)
LRAVVIRAFVLTRQRFLALRAIAQARGKCNAQSAYSSAKADFDSCRYALSVGKVRIREDKLIEYLILFAIVFGVNLMPAFGPPTWSIIVLYGINSNLPVVEIVLVAAAAAALGRFVLANAFRFLGQRVSQKTRDNLAAAREAFERNRRNAILGLGLFALSPVPSAQLFEAAGLAGVRLAGFTAAFFLGRIVSYSIYAYSAEQIVMIAGLVALTRIDWRALLEHRTKKADNED